MNRFTVQMAVCIEILILLTITQAQWVSCGGPKGVDIQLLAANNNTIIAGVGGTNIYLSTDNGNTWSAIGSGLPKDWYPSCMTISGNTIIIASYYNGIYRSANNGKNWVKIPSEVPSMVYCVAENENSIFAGTNSKGLFRSIDNGEHWSSVDFGIDNYDVWVNSISTNGNIIFAGTSKGLFKSTDNGATWSDIASFKEKVWNYLNIIKVAISGTTIFVSTWSGIYRSIDNGSSWTDVGTGIADANAIGEIAIIDTTVLIAAQTTLFSFTTGNIYLSNNNGTNWTPCRLIIRNIFALVASGNSFFAGTWGSGILRTNDNGISWTGVNHALTYYLPAPSIAAMDSTIFVGTRVGVFQCNTRDTNWKSINSDITDYDIGSIVVKGNTIYAGSENAVFSSVNKGTSWNRNGILPLYNDINITGYYPISALTISDSTIIAGRVTYPRMHSYTQIGGFFLSNNNGTTWKDLAPPCTSTYLLLQNRPAFIASMATFNNKVVATIGGLGGVLFSDDNGANWINKKTTVVPIRSLAIIDSLIFAGTVWDSHFDSIKPYPKILLSSYNNDTWASADSGLPDSINVNSLLVYNKNIFAGTTKGIYLSTNRGAHWQSVSAGFPENDTAISLAVINSDLYAGTNHSGIWQCPLSKMVDMNIINRSTPIYHSVLRSVFTSELKNFVSISFAIPSTQPVSIKIFNISGAEVTTIVNNRLYQGSHRLCWDTHAIANGYYLMRMQAGGEVLVKSVRVFH